MYTINLKLSENQVNLLLQAVESLKTVSIKERNKVRDISEINAEQLSQLSANIQALQNIRKQIEVA